MGQALIFLGIVVFAAHLFSMIFSRKKIPDVLLLMLIGIIIGPILGWVTPEFFGGAGAVFTSITLVVILFEGGIDISIQDIKKSWKSTITLTVSSALISAVLTTFICKLFGLSLINSLIVGAILCGTSSAVVIPLAQQLKIGKETKTALILESALTDVLCIIFALAFIESAAAGEALNVGKVAGGVVSSFVLAIIIGFVGALVWTSLLHKVRNFKNSIFLTPAYVFIMYGISESLGFSGAITALAFGITISNMEYFNFKFLEKYQKDKNLKLTTIERSFISEIVFVLKTFFFVYIGISIPFSNGFALITGAVITGVLLVMRLFIAKFCSPKSSNGFDKSVVSLMIPKGLAAAVLASIPMQMGLEQGELIKYIVFSVVLFSILICSIMILIIERFPRANIALRVLFNSFNKKTTNENTQVEQPPTEEKIEEK